MTGAMRRLAVVAIAFIVLPSALHAQIPELRLKKMIERGWTQLTRDFASARWGEHGRIDEFADLVADARWAEDETCQQHKDDMETFLDPNGSAIMYWGEHGTEDGETLRVSDGNVVEWIVMFNWDLYNDWDEERMLRTLLHEGWHWAHKETEEGTAAKNAENCAWIPLEEEDDDEPSQGGGEDPNEGCEQRQRWVPPVTRDEFRKPESTQSSGQRYETEFEPTYVLPGIVVSASSKGRWVTVVVEEGYWETYWDCND